MRAIVTLVCLLSILIVGQAVSPAFLATAQAPTRLVDSQVLAPPASFTAIRILTPSGWIYAQPDATIQIDLTATPPVIRAVLGRDVVDKFTPATAIQTFTMSAMLAPNTALAVYRNGLLMAQDVDYARTGQDVLFLPQQPVAPGDIIQLRYRSLP